MKQNVICTNFSAKNFALRTKSYKTFSRNFIIQVSTEKYLQNYAQKKLHWVKNALKWKTENPVKKTASNSPCRNSHRQMFFWLMYAGWLRPLQPRQTFVLL